MRPFFGLDDRSTNSCVKEATAILEENEPKYPNSSLVMFYRGRVLKIQVKYSSWIKFLVNGEWTHTKICPVLKANSSTCRVGWSMGIIFFLLYFVAQIGEILLIYVTWKQSEVAQKFSLLRALIWVSCTSKIKFIFYHCVSTPYIILISWKWSVIVLLFWR